MGVQVVLDELMDALRKSGHDMITVLVTPSLMSKIDEASPHIQTVPKHETRGLVVKQLVTADGDINLIKVKGDGYAGVIFGRALGVILR